jgi:phage shock protein A
VFETTLTLEQRIARTEAQLAKAKENRRRAYERATKLEKKLERLVAKRRPAKPELVNPPAPTPTGPEAA